MLGVRRLARRARCPRGEFIALQLGRAQTPAARRRERELIRAYQEQWVGALGEWFEPTGRLFEDGLFAGGVLKIEHPVDLDRMLNESLWRLVRTLDVGRTVSGHFELALLDRPELVSLRAVYGLSHAGALAIAEGRERLLTS